MADARISTALPSHPKTKKLIRRLGDGAAWSLVRLLLWTAENRPDGDLEGMTAEDLELAIDWAGAPDELVRALVDVGFLERLESGYRIHDWTEHNPWAAGAGLRSAKARWNAVKRHHGEVEANKQVPEWAAHLHALATGKPPAPNDDAGSNASSTGAAVHTQQRSNAPSPSPSPYPSEEPAENAHVSAPVPIESHLPEAVDQTQWQAFRRQLDDDGKTSIPRIQTAVLQLNRIAKAGADVNAVLRAAVMRGMRDLEDVAEQLSRKRSSDPPGRTSSSTPRPSATDTFQGTDYAGTPDELLPAVYRDALAAAH